jgi:hypothetical protein
VSTQVKQSDAGASRAKDDGGPAFPTDIPDDGACGMSLRDYFAAKAMAALLVRGWVSDGSDNTPRHYCEAADGDRVGPNVLARDAYRIANAMLAQRGGQL